MNLLQCNCFFQNRAKILGPIADDDSENLKDMNFAVEL